MFIEVYEKNKLKGRIFRCHGCDCASKLVKSVYLAVDAVQTPPKGWVEKTELKYSDKTLRHHRRSGWVVNYYCPTCHRLGLTAEAVVQVLKRFLKKKEKSSGTGEVRPICAG